MLEWIVSSSVLIVVLIILRFALRGKISLRLQYALWALVLVRLLVPISFGGSVISVENLTKKAADTEPVRFVTELTEIDIPQMSYQQAYDEVVREYAEKGIKIEELPLEEYAETVDYEIMNKMNGDVSLAETARFVWMCGITLMGIWFMISNLRLMYNLKQNREKLDHIHSIPVYRSDAVDTPCLFGFFRPAIYLTSEAASNDTVARHAVEHELTHYAHMDHIWAVMRCVCLAIHWYNPLVWCAAILSRNDAELACDEATIRRLGEDERAAYGRTLIDLTCRKRTALLNTATTMTGSGRSIKERIALIVKKPKMAVYTLVAVILIAAIAVGCTFTGAKDSPHSFTEWTESLTAEDIQLAEVSKAYGIEKTSYILTVSEYQSLCSMLNGITENDCSVMKPKGSNEDGYRMALYRADKLWLFKCLSDGTIGLMFNDAETGAYFGCEGSLLIIDCPDLWSFIVRMVDEKGTMSDDTSAQTVLYASIEEYVKHRIDQQQVASYYSATEEEELTAAVLDAKVGWLEKQGEVFGLAPNGVLEAWYYNILLKLETDSDDIVLVGGQYEEDGYFDLEGQGGRIVVALRNADGKYDILYDAVINDGMDFYGYCNTVEEAIHDWYVKQYDLEIPLYATEWIDCITVPENGSLSSVPVHRFDGDGWYIYIPVQTWNCPANAETPCVFTSAYYTGSTLKVDYFDYAPAGLSDDHRKQGFTLIDEEKLIWSRNSGGVTTMYYCFDAQDGGCWRVTIEWIDANITNYPYIAMEPDILRLMAESFTVYGYSGTPGIDPLTRLTTLRPEDIKHTAGFCDVDVSELASLLSAAAANRIEYTGSVRAFWTLEVYLSGGPHNFNTGTDEWFSIQTGPEENTVEIIYHSEDGEYSTLYFEDNALYWFVRGTYTTDEIIDEDAYARFGEILAFRAQARVDGSKLNEMYVKPYSGYEIIRLVRVDEFTQGGAKYEIYEWDVAFLHDNPITTLAGGMWVDSQLRVRDLEQETYFVTRTSGNLVDYRFFFWDLYFGQNEESQKTNAYATITEEFNTILKLQTYCTNLGREWQLRFNRNEAPLSILRVDENRERDLVVDGNMISVLSSAANNLQHIGRPDDFKALGGGIYVWYDDTRHLAFFAGEEPFMVLIRYVADDANESAVVYHPQLYLYLVASAECENVQMVNLDEDGELEAILWLYSENNLIIYDWYDDEIRRIDVNQAIGCVSSNYSGLIANVKPEYSSMIQGQSRDGIVSVYRYHRDGTFTYECQISEILR